MSSYLSVRQNLSIYTLSSERPLPSIDSFAVQPSSSKHFVNFSEVYCEP